MLIRAQDTATPLPESERQTLTLEEAYAVQSAIRDEKVRQGHRVVGKKIGFTGRAMRALFKVDEPDYGNLFSDQMFPQGGAVAASRFVAPKVEGEIAFVLKRDVTGPGVTPADVLAATRGVMACIEFVDFRWGFQANILDSIADNASCGGFALGSKLAPLKALDLRHEGMFVEKNGELVNSGAGVEVMGDPLNAVVWLANALAAHGDGLHAGDIILSGSLTAAVPVQAGDAVTVSFATLGSVSVRFT